MKKYGGFYKLPERVRFYGGYGQKKHSFVRFA
jgi:hypothetical protein